MSKYLLLLLLLGCNNIDYCYVPYGVWEFSYTSIEGDCPSFSFEKTFEGSIEDLEYITTHCTGYNKFDEYNCSSSFELNCIIYDTGYPVGKVYRKGYLELGENNITGKTREVRNYFNGKTCSSTFSIKGKQ